MNDELNIKLQKIKVLIMDIDGTLTDAKTYYSKNGEELKSFNIKDGMGIVLWHKSGLKTAFLTSESSEIITRRAEKLNISKVVLGSRQKKADTIDLAQHFQVSLEELAYIGDDINDLDAIKICGLSACPADSTKSILESVDLILEKNGGSGAVRELIEKILVAQGKPILLEEKW
jgi:3-deoxy-D-manno-octulosonate 8-phosphate phosphatase (KDO 8-P phosphatase)